MIAKDYKGSPALESGLPSAAQAVFSVPAGRTSLRLSDVVKALCHCRSQHPSFGAKPCSKVVSVNTRRTRAQ